MFSDIYLTFQKTTRKAKTTWYENTIKELKATTDISHGYNTNEHLENLSVGCPDKGEWVKIIEYASYPKR